MAWLAEVQTLACGAGFATGCGALEMLRSASEGGTSSKLEVDKIAPCGGVVPEALVCCNFCLLMMVILHAAPCNIDNIH